MTVTIESPTAAGAGSARLPWRTLLAAANPARFVPAIWRQRHLVSQLTWREITGRYRSSVLGLAWSFITPLVMLSLYTFVFGVVFKARWPGAPSGSLTEFGLMLFAGLTAFSLFSECVVRAPSLITGSPNYVKKVVFPLEVLPVSVLGSALFHAAISMAMVVVARQVIVGGALDGAPVMLFAPVVLVPLVCLALGVSWFLASLGVFLRDIGHAVTLATQALLFLTPIFYPVSALPERLQIVVKLNPLSPVVDGVRRILVQGLQPDWSPWLYSLAAGIVVLCAGHAWFAMSKRAFADVI